MAFFQHYIGMAFAPIAPRMAEATAITILKTVLQVDFFIIN
jgi:hypothetical protein